MEQGVSQDQGQRLDVTVAGDEGSRRLDRVLAVRAPALSRSRLKALILAGSVSIGPTPVRDPAYHVAAGDTITIDVPPAVAPDRPALLAARPPASEPCRPDGCRPRPPFWKRLSELSQ